MRTFNYIDLNNINNYPCSLRHYSLKCALARTVILITKRETLRNIDTEADSLGPLVVSILVNT